MTTIYDVELNRDRDRVILWRKGRVAHQWTLADAEWIRDRLTRALEKANQKALK